VKPGIEKGSLTFDQFTRDAPELTGTVGRNGRCDRTPADLRTGVE